MTSIIETISNTVLFLFLGNPPTSAGTGFVVGYPSKTKPDEVIPFVVTARHVIGENQRIFVRYSTTDPKKPGLAEYDVGAMRQAGDFFPHPDEGVDIAIFRIPAWSAAKLNFVPYDLVATKQVFEGEDIQPTDRIIFPSLLMNFIGTGRNYPVMRNGAIALIPDERVPLKFKVGDREISTEQNVLLVNATSMPGASGSPVFLDPGPRIKANQYNLGGTKTYLLGVMHGFYQTAPRELTNVETTGAKQMFQENSGIAIVFPSWRIREIVESEPFQKRVKEIDEQISKVGSPRPSP